MAIIYSYPAIEEISSGDLILVSDSSKKNATKSATVDQLSAYIGSSEDSIFLKEKTITLGYNELSALNGGTSTITFTIPGLTSTSALAIVDVLAYLEAGTTAFDLSFSTFLNLGLGSGSNFKPKMRWVNNGNFINSSTSVYFNQGVQPMTHVDFFNPSPLGAELSVKFEGSGGVTQGNGILKLKVLYRIVDFS